MLSSILKLGDKIEIIHMDKFGKPYHNARSYVSQLIDFVDVDVIQIATPIVYSTPVILNVGENYNLCFYTSNGLYQCNCVALKNFKENNLIIAVVRITTNLEKYQRRQYYRLDYVDSIQYRVITSEEELLKKRLQDKEFENKEEYAEYKKRISEIENNWVPAVMMDISGGGTRFISETRHEKGDILKIQLNLVIAAGIKSLNIEAVVVSSVKMPNKAGSFEHRVEFSNIMKKDREELIKYIFEQERKRRKNV